MSRTTALHFHVIGAVVISTLCTGIDPIVMAIDDPAVQTDGLSDATNAVDDSSSKGAVIADPIPLSAQANAFLKGLLLVLIPSPYVDEDDWGKTRRIQSGLNVKLDGLKVRTKRRWKNVDHGVWKRAEIRLHQPEDRFQLQVELLPPQDGVSSRYRVHASARIRVLGRQQSWNNGVKLYSISGDATADVALQSDVTLHRTFVETADGSRLRVLPTVESLDVAIKGFRLQRVGHAKGTLVREFGRSLRSILNRTVQRKGPRMVTKINAKIQKKPERFEIPLGIFGLLTGSQPVQEPLTDSP